MVMTGYHCKGSKTGTGIDYYQLAEQIKEAILDDHEILEALRQIEVIKIEINKKNRQSVQIEEVEEQTEPTVDIRGLVEQSKNAHLLHIRRSLNTKKKK